MKKELEAMIVGETKFFACKGNSVPSSCSYHKKKSGRKFKCVKTDGGYNVTRIA